MQAWLLQGVQENDKDELGGVLRQWSSRPENREWTVDYLRLTTGIAVTVQTRRPDVLVLAEPSCPAGSWVAEVMAQGVGLVVATSLERAEPYRSFAELHAIQLIPLPASVEGIGLAILNVLSHLRRQQTGQTRIDQLQQRLNDRIVIERAKGILVDRLGISEKEAYQRLRVLSRQQRRQIRDIAQFVLAAKSLFVPETNGSSNTPHREEPPALDRPGPTL
ncbi:MAG TPA: ANTAR domain-containing protein [Gemmataceae bacterium]|nr:ANTAR domain-containing protein [Gemmataceae bacterium]